MAELTGIDHLYLSVADLARSEPFYDQVLIGALGFRKSRFALGDEPHLHYFNRDFGIVLRPARVARAHEPYAPGLHHVCLRVDSIAEVRTLAAQLRAAGVAATEAALYPQYADDYWATFFTDPDGIRLEITNHRHERRERHDHWDDLAAAATAPAGTAQTVLTPMRPEGFTAFVAHTIVSYAEGNLAAGRWPAEGALARSRAEFETLLPQGLATPDNHLLDIRAGESGPIIGSLWFAIESPRGLPSAFVYDLAVHPAWRRQGHARRALAALEPLARAHGASRIGLHVFGHNTGAQALYTRLGYGVTGMNMLKWLGR